MTILKTLNSPQISKVESFNVPLLQLDYLVYNQALTGNYLAKLFEKLGIIYRLLEKPDDLSMGI